MSRRRWTITKASQGRWLILTFSPGLAPWRTYRPSFDEAVVYLQKAISRAAIEELLNRALSDDGGEKHPLEYVSVRASLITGDTLDAKRRTIYDAARHQGLLVATEAEDEEDPRDSRIFIRVKRQSFPRRKRRFKS